MNNLEPLEDNILVRPDEPETKVGQIILADQAQQRTVTGTVVAVGPGKLVMTRRPVQVAVGDRIMFRAYGVEPIPDTEGGKLMMSEDKVLARIIESPIPNSYADGLIDHIKTNAPNAQVTTTVKSTWEADAEAQEQPPKAPELGVVQQTGNTPKVNHPLASTSNLDASLEKYTARMEQQKQAQ